MNTATQAFEAHMMAAYAATYTQESFALTPDGEYKDMRVRSHYAIWEAARNDFQKRLDAQAERKDLNREVKFLKDCDCGCNAPTFDEPFEALRFLMNRMNHAGVGEAVAASYAHDIAQILKTYNAMEKDDHLLITEVSDVA